MRSRIFLCLVIMLMAVILVMPISIRGDGTVNGLVHIIVTYTLGLAGIILSLTTLWAGSSAVSSEIDDKTIQMVATKPVPKHRLWLGKWLGLNALNSALLLVCGIATYSMLQWHLHPDRLTDEGQLKTADQLLSARRTIRPSDSNLDQLVQSRLDQIIQNKKIPPGMSVEETSRRLRQQLENEHNTISPGGKKTWNFGRVNIPETDNEVVLQFQFSSSVIGQSFVHGHWLIGTPDNPEIIRIEEDYASRVQCETSFKLDSQWRDAEVTATYINDSRRPVSLIFDSGNMCLLVHEGSFIENYFRAFLIMFGQLAFLAAIGITAGCLFSLPVASFVSFFMLILIQMGSYIEDIAATKIIWPDSSAIAENAMSWSAIFIALIFKALALMMHPLIHENALNYISTGRMIGTSWTLNVLVLQGVAYSLIMGLLASRILNRRELALPSL